MASQAMMREYVSRQYGGSWPDRVREMPDNQVAAIYGKMVDELERLKNTEIPKKMRETDVRGGIQLSFFENERSTKTRRDLYD